MELWPAYDFQSINPGSNLHLKHVAISFRHPRSVTIQSPPPLYFSIMVFESVQLWFGAIRTWYGCWCPRTSSLVFKHDEALRQWFHS